MGLFAPWKNCLVSLAYISVGYICQRWGDVFATKDVIIIIIILLNVAGDLVEYGSVCECLCVRSKHCEWLCVE